MPTVSSEYIDKVIATGVAPYLKTLGFSRRGRRFLLAGELSIANVTVQASQWNTPSCTLDLGQYFEAIERKMPIVLEPSKQRRHHIWSSSPEESHPQALTQRYVNLSIHTAPIVQPTVTATNTSLGPGFQCGNTLRNQITLENFHRLHCFVSFM